MTVTAVAGLAIFGCADSMSPSNAQDETEQNAPKTHGEAATKPGELRVDSGVSVASEVNAGANAAGGKVSLGPGLQRLADMAKKDLGEKLGIDQAEIEIVEAVYVTWRDSGIGCPQPGYQYLQVLTNGSRILLRANKTIYHYHSGDNQPPFLCEKPSATEPLPYQPNEA